MNIAICFDLSIYVGFFMLGYSEKDQNVHSSNKEMDNMHVLSKLFLNCLNLIFVTSRAQ